MERSGVEESLKEYRRPFDCAQGDRGAFFGGVETFRVQSTVPLDYSANSLKKIQVA
jgi:hypothetical protein